MFSGKEAGELQQSRKKNACADRNGEAQQSQEQKKEIHNEKHRGHDSGNLFKNQAFLLVKLPRIIVYGTAKENLERGSGHKTGEKDHLLFINDKSDQEQKGGEQQR